MKTKTLKALILSALAVAGACIARAESVSYREPVFDARGAVTGFTTRYAECTEINWGYNPASGGICGSGSMTLSAGWYVVSGNFQISSTLTVSGDVKLILRNGAKFDVNYEGKSRGGLRVEEVNSLTIYAQSEGDGMGWLSATGGKYAAGIGSGSADKARCGMITINGGKITAKGGHQAAGIGGGKAGDVTGFVRINGGAVTATGGENGAGIGGGYKGAGSNIAISGGAVTATSGIKGGAGIGGGDLGIGSNISIYGGRVEAKSGGTDIGAGAGIGGGCRKGGSDIWISGGEVIATGGEGGAGIGGGYEGCGSKITIKGGSVTAKGGTDGAGIGGGARRGCSEIVIRDGTVAATGGEGGAGIGGGGFSDDQSGLGDEVKARFITISGGTVTATGGEKAAGIGGGKIGIAQYVTISGGEVTAQGGIKGGAGIGGGLDAGCDDITLSGGLIRAVAGGSILPDDDDDAHINAYTSSWDGGRYERGMDIGAGGYWKFKASGFASKAVKLIPDIGKWFSAEMKIGELLFKEGNELTLKGISSKNLMITGGTVEALMIGGCDDNSAAPVTITGGSVHTLVFSKPPTDANGDNVDLLVFTDAKTSPADLKFLDEPKYNTDRLYPNTNDTEYAYRLFLWPIVDTTTSPSGSSTSYETNRVILLDGAYRRMNIAGSKVWAKELVSTRVVTYTLSGFLVNGVDVNRTSSVGPGWLYFNDVLMLTNAMDYTLSGLDTTGKMHVRVTTNATVMLGGLALTPARDENCIRFTSHATDAKLVLAGDNKIYSQGGYAAVAVDSGAKVTLSGTGALVGGKSAGVDSRGVKVEAGGALVMDDGTISGYRTSDKGGAIFNNGTFTMNGGTITGCQSDSYGGGLCCVDGTAELNAGSISRCTATFGGALTLWNSGTVDVRSGMEISGTSAVSHGAVFLQGGTVNVWGGTFRNNAVYTGVLTDWMGTLNVYGGVFADNSVKPVHREGSSVVAVSGGVYDVAPDAGLIVSGYDATKVGSNYVVGQNVTARNGQLTGGTYTFNPTNDEYAAAGVTVMRNCSVTENPVTTPETYVVHLPAGFYVNGVKLTDGPGEGWTFDLAAGLLSLTNAMDYALSGFCEASLKVDVTANANVSLTDIRIVPGDLGRAVFNVTASDARFSLGGSNEVYTTDGNAAIGVASGAKLTLEGDGALVGGRTADATCLGVSVTNGTFVMNGGTISGYKGDSYGGGLHCVNGNVELNAGTITNCTAHFGGALALWNSGTVNIRSGMEIGGNSATSHGAVFQQGGTVNVYGGTFTGNSVATGVLTDWMGTLNVYGGVFGGNSVKPVYRRDGSTVAVSGGVYDVAPDAGLIVSGFAATQVGANQVVGQGVTQADNKLTGGTYAFDPSRQEYAAAGLAIAKQHRVEALGTDPETYRVHVAADFKVDGVRLEDGTGEDGWTFTQDGKKGTLTLTDARAYALSGYADLTLLVDVLSNATVTLNGICIRAGAAGRAIFSVSAEDATFVLKGVNEVYASDGQAAIGVGAFAKLTVTGEGELVGGRAANANGRGFTVYGTLALNGGTIRDYYTTADGGAVYNAGTFTVYGGTLSGNVSTVRGGAICNAGTIRIYGGRFRDNATTGDLSWGGFCFGWTGCQTYIYGGSFSGNRTQTSGNANLYIAHNRVTGTGYLFGGVFADDPTAPAESSGCLVPQGGAAVTSVGDLYVVGQDVTQEGDALTGGTYAFDPSDDVYAAGGVAVAAEHVVLAQATDPKTYVIDWNWTDFLVDGTDLVIGSGDGWSYDFTTGLLMLDAAKTYVLSGALTRKDLDLGVKADAAGATVVFSNATIVSSALSPLTANAAGVRVELAGDNRVEVASGGASTLPAIAVPVGASVTIVRSEEARGGALDAVGGSKAAAIGGEGEVVIASGIVTARGGIAGASVTISGGTVSATGREGKPDIDGAGVRLTGGSVVAGSVTNPKNADGASVYCVTVPDVASRGPVAITNVSQLVDSYGQDDLYPVGGSLSLWLPNGIYNGFYVGDDPTPYYAAVDGEATVAIRKLLALYVNGELVTVPEHAEGWSFEDGVLTLDAATNYVVTGESTDGSVRIVVANGCDLTLSGVRLGMGDTEMNANLLWVAAGVVNLTIDGATAFQVNGSKKPIGVNAGATLNICGSGTAFAWGVEGDGSVTMQDPTSLAFTTQAAAEAAAAVVKPVADESVFEGIDQKEYGNRFVVSAVENGSGLWTFDYQISEATSNELYEAISSEETLTNLVAAISSTNGTPKVTITPIPGFYYGMAGAVEVTEMNSDVARPPAWYAGQEGADLEVKGTTFQDAVKAFYQLKATAQP